MKLITFLQLGHEIILGYSDGLRNFFGIFFPSSPFLTIINGQPLKMSRTFTEITNEEISL